MITIDKLQARALRAAFAVRDRYAALTDKERGDVPGWVLITIMTAGLVTVLYTAAKGTLVTLFDKAVNSVSGGK